MTLVALWAYAVSAHRGAEDLAVAAMAGEVKAEGTDGAGQAGGMAVSAMARATGAGFTLGLRVDAAVPGLAEALPGWEAGRVGGRARFACSAAAEILGGERRPRMPLRPPGVVEYAAHRGVFLPTAVTPRQRAFHERLLPRVRGSPAEREVLDSRMLEPSTAVFSRRLAE
jgi:hypothetical protein